MGGGRFRRSSGYCVLIGSRRRSRARCGGLRLICWAAIVQTFADDASTAAGQDCREAVLHIAWLLRGALAGRLSALDPDVLPPKRSNFLVECSRKHPQLIKMASVHFDRI